IAEVEIAARNAMEGAEDDLRLEVERGDLRAHRLRDGADIDGIVEIGRSDSETRLPAHRLQRVERLVADGGARGRAILGIEREYEDAVAAGRLHGGEALADRGLAVAHRPIDEAAPRRIAPALGEGGGELLGRRAGDRLQGAFVELPVPDGRIILLL